MNNNVFIYFKLWKEYFAFDINYAVEVMKLPQDIVPVPSAPEYVLGVFNYRGEIIPVIDLRKKFKLPDQNNDLYLLVIKHIIGNKQEKLALAVDKILDVINVTQQDISQFPELGSRYNVEFIYGVINYNDKFILVLNMEKILSSAEIEIIRSIKKKGLENEQSQTPDN